MSYEIDQGTGSGGGARFGRRVVDLYEATAPEVPVGYEMTITKNALSDAVVRKHRTTTGQTQETRNRKNPAIRDAIRRALLDAGHASEKMVKAHESADFIELANVGFQLEQTLRDLWKYRDHREDQWGDLLNLLQTALAQEEFERFSNEQCRAIRKVIVEHLALGSVDEDDVFEAVRLLRDSGLDPWKAISGKDFTDDENHE